jgi:hypothetical protein
LTFLAGLGSTAFCRLVPSCCCGASLFFATSTLSFDELLNNFLNTAFIMFIAHQPSHTNASSNYVCTSSRTTTTALSIVVCPRSCLDTKNYPFFLSFSHYDFLMSQQHQHCIKSILFRRFALSVFLTI